MNQITVDAARSLLDAVDADRTTFPWSFATEGVNAGEVVDADGHELYNNDDDACFELMAAAPDLARGYVELHAECARLRDVLDAETGTRGPPGWKAVHAEGHVTWCFAVPGARDVLVGRLGDGRVAWQRGDDLSTDPYPTFLAAMEAAPTTVP